MTEESLKMMCSIATRTNDKAAFDAVVDGQGEQSGVELLEYFGTTAVISVVGPIFRYADFFTKISGATSVQALSSAIAEAEKTAEKIIFNFDTPGGEATEISSMAERINSIKIPTVAYVGAMAASAGYWLASATDKIVIGSTGMVGSIGVIATFPKKGEDNTVEIISSQSPDKRLDVETEEGAAKMQVLIDKMAGIFVADVAKYRGVTEEKVLSDFGKGGMLIGADAVAAGMADAIGNIKDLTTIQREVYNMAGLTLSEKMKKLEASDAELFEAIKKEGYNEGFESASADVKDEKNSAYNAGFKAGKEQELARIKGVKEKSVKGYEDVIEQMMLDGKSTPEQAACGIVEAMQAKNDTVLDLLASTPAPIEDEVELSKEEKEYARDPSLQRDFASVEDYKKFLKAQESGLIRISGRK